MVTSFSIRFGYDSDGHNKNMKLIDYAKRVNMDDFRKKLMEYGINDKDTLDQIIDLFSELPTEDSTLGISKDKDNNEYIHMSASGGGQWREWKEISRKAFGVLLLDECHKSGLCVSFITG